MTALKNINDQADLIDQITNDLREQVFRVISLENDYYLVLYLANDLRTIQLSLLNSLFLPSTLEELPTNVLIQYAELRKQIEDLSVKGYLSVEGDEKAKEKLLNYLRSQRKGVADFGIVDPSGKLL